MRAHCQHGDGVVAAQGRTGVRVSNPHRRRCCTGLKPPGASEAAPPQAVTSWMHLAVVRLFVESILRYGLPPAFLAAVVRPAPKLEGRLRTALSDGFGTGERAEHMQGSCPPAAQRMWQLPACCCVWVLGGAVR